MENSVKQDVQESPDGIDHFNMGKAEWQELCAAMLDLARKGQLRAVVLMMEAPAGSPKGPDGERLVNIESFGTMECIEIACRKANEKLAKIALASGNEVLAGAIRAGMRGGAKVQ